MNLFDRPILAIETSCDETSASVLIGREILSNVVASQVDMHRKWGGVVPEAAARAHLEALLPTLSEAMQQSGLTLDEIGAIAVTNRPGLIGALSVGVSAAKALAFTLDVPLLGVHHLEGHILSTQACPEPLPFPHTCLVVSGGHTELVDVRAPGEYVILGQTLDDAAGEAFDKGARLLGLGYPGGKAIQDAAMRGRANRYQLPRGLKGETANFSFSGLKTAVARLVEREGSDLSVPDAAASLQEAIVSVLTQRALVAAEMADGQALTLVGGVAANQELRRRLAVETARRGIPFLTPPIPLCTDNAAMIGLAGSFRLARGERHGDDVEAQANAELGS